jgi:tetratricopeptide (TPR) repeat protein
MGGTFLGALLVRLLYVAALRDTVFFEHPLLDAEWHWEWARAWAAGEGDEPRAFFRAPLYPFFLTVLVRLFGPDLLAVRLVQAAVGASGAAALAGAGWRLGGRGTGIAAGVAAALYGPLVHFDGELLIPNLLVALLSWALFAFAARTPMGVLTGAGLVGLAGIARPNALVLLPVVAIIAFRAGPAARRGLRAGLAALLVLLPAALVTARNLAVEPGLVVVASQGGVNLYAGNHRHASGRGVEIPELRDAINWREFVAASETVAEEAAGRDLTSAEVNRYWLDRTREAVLDDPDRALLRTAKKAFFLVHGYEIPNNRDLYYERPAVLQPLLWSTPFLSFPWGLLLPLAVAGFVAARRRPELAGPAHALAAGAGLYALSILPFFVCARFRMALVPALVLLAAFLVTVGWRAVPRRAWVAGALALGLANAPLFAVRAGDRSQELVRRGALHLQDGRTAEGLAMLEEAIALSPESVIALYLVADARYEAGDLPGAIEGFETVVAQRPDDARARFTLGTAYLRLDRFEPAAHHLAAANKLRVGDVATLVNLGAALEGLDRDFEAEEIYREAIRFGPKAEIPFLALADLYAARGDTRNEIRLLDRGVGENRDSFPLRYRYTEALTRAGEYDRALEEIDMALKIRPDDPDARRVQAWLTERTSGN